MSNGDINTPETIQETLEWLGQFGRTSDGGVTRLLYSAEWVETQNALKKAFQDDGFVTEFDEIGNLYGRLEGTNHSDETILTGSHVDSVTNGGLFDGVYGIVAGYLALKYLKENYGSPLRNLEVVSMAEEEGSRFPYGMWGSKNMVGIADAKDVEGITDADGVKFEDAMHQAGFDFKKNPAEVREDIKAFLEIHVEQGHVLAKENKKIGIVQHIVGQRRFTITVDGEANHAGTTPMAYRKDAMKAASHMISKIIDMAEKKGDPQVATVGQLSLEPNTVNVVPGKAVFSLDIRHTDSDELESFTDEVKEQMNGIANSIGVDIDIDMWMDNPPVPMDQDIVDTIQRQCESNNLDYKLMHSGAGHDSQVIAPVVPTAMIFARSPNGISHSPQEYSSPEDLAEGLNAMIQTLYELAYKE